ncbi:MAG TPA: transglycosylase SLT domain-containing protein [Bacteroidia bacterium]|nr:transglycosylase SLT domain-containing protein [Bacteroidia bacterium]
MKRILVLLFVICFSSTMNGETVGATQVVVKTVITAKDTLRLHFLRDSSLYKEGWDTLAQARFWREVISMTSDSCIINIASCRKPVDVVSRSVWMNQTDPQKICFKDSVCIANCLDSATNLYITAGKGEFYEVKKALLDISKAIDVFEAQDCDPWYAQAILLIESPGKKKAKSYVGAGGPFQLMRSVAKRYGMRITKYQDDRSDLEKSAKVAAKLLKAGCIANVKKYLDERGIVYKETDIWFRLLVLHAYHAGAGNVHCVINALNPSKGGVDLFLQIWQTTCGGFKNESQNYSQIALASLLNFDQLVQQDGDTVYLVQGDKYLKKYHRKGLKPWEAYAVLTNCLRHYEQDFIDDMISYDYFMKRVNAIRKEYTFIASAITNSDKEIALRKYPASEEHVNSLAAELTKRQRYEDAVRILRLNLDMNPDSPAIRDSLERAMRLSGTKSSGRQVNSGSAGLPGKSLRSRK